MTQQNVIHIKKSDSEWLMSKPEPYFAMSKMHSVIFVCCTGRLDTGLGPSLTPSDVEVE